MKTIYDWTGEYRRPKKGEYFLTAGARIEQAASNHLKNEYLILSPRQEEATKDE